MTAKVENYCASKRTRILSVEASMRACMNCIWYEQYYRKNRGNISGWVPVCSGYCLQHEQQRGPLRQPCRKFETMQ